MHPIKSLLTSLPLLALAPALSAGVVISNNAPILDGADIAQFVQNPGNSTGLNYYFYTDYERGSTFTTGGIAATLDAVSFGIFDSGNVGPFALPNMKVTIGSVSGNTFTPVYTESNLGWDGAQTVSSGQWVTLNLSTPVSLSPNTLYAYSIINSGSDGYAGLGNTSSDLLAGARVISLSGGTISYASDVDATFHLNMAAIPEPSTYAALAGALALGWVIYRRRRA